MAAPKDKYKFALWLYPETLAKVKELYRKDDCVSKSEFIEKAIRFYIGFLTAEDKSNFLPNMFLSNMRGIVSESDTRISRLLFKMSVEMAIMMNLLAFEYTFAHRQMIYESAQYHNAVFVGFDQEGVPRHANMRGTGSESTFKGNADSSIPEYSFHWSGRSKYLLLFEGPIDMLSFISMHKKNWQQHSYAAACSVSDRVLFQMLKDNPNISEVFLCMDSDEPGQAAAKRISDKLFTKGINARILVPEHKDWNEDLLYLKQEESEVEESCQALQL